jgi:hypothetical protein
MGRLFDFCLTRGIDPEVGRKWTIYEYYLLLERESNKQYQNIKVNQ